MRSRFALIGLILAMTAPFAHAACIVVAPATPLQLEGALSQRDLPGPPNYESIADGDAVERTYILELATEICIADDGHFADAKAMFKTIQLVPIDDHTRFNLKEKLGETFVVSGFGFAAHTGHHHAPLVLNVDAIRIP